jgi:hypothetical protein
MPETWLPDDAPATALFPQFESAIYRMITTEVEGLTDGQLDFESDRWEWSKWSIRRNLSHMASGDFRWFLLRWGRQLFPEGLPDLGDDLEDLAASPHDRRLDEDKYWDLDSILEKLRQGLEVAQLILSRETVGSLRSKETGDAGPSPGRWFAEAHPTGIRWESDDSSRSYLTLEASFRHRYFEHVTHLYNIQRLKRAQGLPTLIEVPFEGYWALPDWDRSEP